jgi:hypothetical protein
MDQSDPRLRDLGKRGSVGKLVHNQATELDDNSPSYRASEFPCATKWHFFPSSPVFIYFIRLAQCNPERWTLNEVVEFIFLNHFI